MRQYTPKEIEELKKRLPNTAKYISAITKWEKAIEVTEHWFDVSVVDENDMEPKRISMFDPTSDPAAVYRYAIGDYCRDAGPADTFDQLYSVDEEYIIKTTHIFHPKELAKIIIPNTTFNAFEIYVFLHGDLPNSSTSSIDSGLLQELTKQYLYCSTNKIRATEHLTPDEKIIKLEDCLHVCEAHAKRFGACVGLTTAVLNSYKTDLIYTIQSLQKIFNIYFVTKRETSAYKFGADGIVKEMVEFLENDAGAMLVSNVATDFNNPDVYLVVDASYGHAQFLTNLLTGFFTEIYSRLTVSANTVYDISCKTSELRKNILANRELFPYKKPYTNTAHMLYSYIDVKNICKKINGEQ